MADYGKTMVGVLYSPNSDYSDPEVNFSYSKAYTTPVRKLDIQVSATTTGTTIEMGFFAAAGIKSLVIINEDTTNFVEAAFTDRATANKLTIWPGDFIKVCNISDLALDLVLDADTAACVCRVIAYGT